MADSRSLSFGVQFGTDTAPLDELNEKQRKVQEEAEQTADKLEQIGTSLTDVGTRATAAFNNVSGAGTKMGTSVRSAMLESIKQGDSLAKTLRTGLGAAVSNVQAKFKGMGAATKSVATDIGNAFKHPIQTIKATLGKALNGAEEDARGLGTQADDTGRRLDDMGKKGAGAGENLVGVLKKVAAAAAGLAIIKKGAEAIKEFCSTAIDAAANAEETNSKFETVFKGAADATNTWAENFAAAAHRSKNEVKGFLADSGAIFTGIGMGAEDASVMSEMMTSLSYDLASFNNLADEDAFNKLRSGLMGETEGLKSMGIVLNDTAIKQSMLQMGITDEFNTLDEATKVQVRWNAILAQTGDAQQDVTRTAGSYTNSVKGVKGIWADFLADAGAKFTPVLTTFFNTIIDSWPTIEPMLMQLVDLLADGLSQAIPILVQLGSQLLPVFCDALALIFQVMQPLIPVIGNLAATLLPPLASILSMLVGALLPPLTTILNVVCNDILVPLMPIISAIASAILPPIAQLLGVVAPLLQAIAPILQVIGQILTVVADAIGTIIGWVADGVGAVVNFFDKLFGGAKEAQGGMEDLAESTNSVASSIPDIGTIEMPAVEIPDTSAYTGAIQSAMDTAPIMAEESWGAAKETATSGLEEIGTSANDTYGAMAAQAESAWDRMKTAAASAVSATITELQKLKNAINSVGSITISTGGVTSTPVQGHASGTNDFSGGLTRINEQGGEMAILPSGSQIIPADQTENIINTSRHSKSVTFAPQISVTMSGNASDEEKEQTKAWFLQMCRDAYRQMQNEDTNIEALQASLA
jgi:phage-related protein